jgi:hypothetical protein
LQQRAKVSIHTAGKVGDNYLEFTYLGQDVLNFQSKQFHFVFAQTLHVEKQKSSILSTLQVNQEVNSNADTSQGISQSPDLMR